MPVGFLLLEGPTLPNWSRWRIYIYIKIYQEIFLYHLHIFALQCNFISDVSGSSSERRRQTQAIQVFSTLTTLQGFLAVGALVCGGISAGFTLADGGKLGMGPPYFLGPLIAGACVSTGTRSHSKLITYKKLYLI
jgi:hypothetical protein